jgi:hypothetical protein
VAEAEAEVVGGRAFSANTSMRASMDAMRFSIAAMPSTWPSIGRPPADLSAQVSASGAVENPVWRWAVSL